ncbi:MAG: inorganic phosphate transporter [Candidatus Thorarchaeota archaeon]
MDPILIALLGIGFVVGAAIGSNDETWSPAVGAQILTVTAAVAIGAIINFVGAIAMGGGVSNKVGGELVNYAPMSIQMVFAILISMAIWLLAASATKGLPISTTQCIVGAVMGVGTYAAYLGLTGWDFRDCRGSLYACQTCSKEGNGLHRAGAPRTDCWLRSCSLSSHYFSKQGR